MIYTSYFSNQKKFLKENIIPVSVAGKVDFKFNYPSIKELAPTYNIWKEYKDTGDWNEYTKRYKSEILSKLKPEEILEKITKIENDYQADVALVCFEGSDKNCHRHLITDWLNPLLDYKIKEWWKPKKIKFDKKNIYTINNANEIKEEDMVFCGYKESVIKKEIEKYNKSLDKSYIHEVCGVDLNSTEPFFCELKNGGGYYPMVYLVKRG